MEYGQPFSGEEEYYRYQASALLGVCEEVDRLVLAEDSVRRTHSILPYTTYETDPCAIEPKSEPFTREFLRRLVADTPLDLSQPQDKDEATPAGESDAEEKDKADYEMHCALGAVHNYMVHRLAGSPNKWTPAAIHFATIPTSARYYTVNRHVAELEYDITKVRLAIARPPRSGARSDAQLYQSAEYYKVLAENRRDISTETTALLSLNGIVRHIELIRASHSDQSHFDGFHSFPDTEFLEDLTTDLTTLR